MRATVMSCRKPTHTDQYLAYDSYHPQSVKRYCQVSTWSSQTDHQQAIRNNPGEKHPSTVLVANSYPPSFLQKVTKTRNSTPERETAEFKSTVLLPYIKRVSEPLRRHLQQQGICTVFKSDTTLRSRLVRPKDPADPNKQDGVVFKIPCTCGKVYIRETGRPMQEKWTSRQGYTTRTHSEFCGLRTCQRHAALERNQIYWLRKPLVHKESERGNLHKTQPKQNKQRQRNWNTGSVHVDSYNEETSKPTTHEKPANAWGNHGTWKQ